MGPSQVMPTEKFPTWPLNFLMPCPAWLEPVKLTWQIIQCGRRPCDGTGVVNEVADIEQWATQPQSALRGLKRPECVTYVVQYQGKCCMRAPLPSFPCSFVAHSGVGGGIPGSGGRAEPWTFALAHKYVEG